MTWFRNLSFPVGIEEIKKIIPHREPFLFFDEVREMVVTNKIQCIKATKIFTEKDLFYKGHFPENPITPGVLMVEACAQASIILGKAATDNVDGLFLFTGIEDVKFKALAKPNDVLEIYAEIKKIRDPMFVSEIKVSVDGCTVLEGTIKAFRSI